MSLPKVSIIIHCRNEEEYIEKNVLSLLNQSYEGEVEILVVDGMSEDRTQEITNQLIKQHHNVFLLENPNKITSHALNIGITHSTGEYFAIIGGHSYVDENFIKYNVEILQSNEQIGCSGGVIKNIHLNDAGAYISKAMGSKFGVGNAVFRTGGKKGFVDTVAFGMYRKSVIDKIGTFDENLVRNQDDEFNFRLLKAGFKIYFSPEVISYYYVRGAYSKLSKQYYQYGYWKIFVNRKHQQITTLRQLFPSLLILGIILGLVLALINKAFLFFPAIIVLLYLVLASAFSLKNSSSLKDFFSTIYCFFTLHFSYGMGYIKGIIDFLILQRDPPEKLKETTRVTKSRKKKLLILTQYFPPEVGAPQNRLFELAIRLEKKDIDVSILTAMPNYPKMEIHQEYIGKRYCYEEVNNLKIYRSSIYVSKKKTIFARLLNYFSFVWSSYKIGKKKLDASYDYILCESPPLFLGISAFYLCKKKKAKLIFNVSDLWPESAEKLGLVKNRIFLSIAQWLEEFLYKKSNLITGQTQGIVKNINSRFPDKNVYWLPNGVDLNYYNPANISSNWREKNNFKSDDFLFFYGGIIGHAQGLEIILNTAKLLKDNQKIKFIILGDGPEKQKLIKLKENMQIDNVFFYPSISKVQMPEIIKAIDVSIIPLKRLDLFKGAIPSKIFENLGMKKPILLGVEGEAKELFIDEGKCGLAFEPENHIDLAEKCKQIISDKEAYQTFAENGRSYVNANFNRDKIAENLLLEIKTLD